MKCCFNLQKNYYHMHRSEIVQRSGGNITDLLQHTYASPKRVLYNELQTLEDALRIVAQGTSFILPAETYEG